MAAGDYSGYPSAVPVRGSRSACRSCAVGVLAVMGLLQVLSSVVVLLHLTGYLSEVDLSDFSFQQKDSEEVEPEPIRADALKGLRKRERQRCPRFPREGVPIAHLPILESINYVKRGDVRPTVIQWKDSHGHLEKMRYHDGRLLVEEAGWYSIYAKTCFRYYEDPDPKSEYLQDGNAQLMQYVSQEKHTQSRVRSIVLMKSGSTKRWKHGVYNMYCEEQSGTFSLKEGDGIFVNVSNAWLLDPDPEGSYFGAFKISN